MSPPPRARSRPRRRLRRTVPVLALAAAGLVVCAETPLEGGGAARRAVALHAFIAADGEAIAAVRGFPDGGRLGPSAGTTGF